MSTLRSLLRILTESGPRMVLIVTVALLVGIAGPASAQFFNFGFQQRPAPVHRGGGWFGNDNPFFTPFQQQPPPAPKRPVENYSHAPPPEKRDTVAERNVLVLGDAMADWLGYGLEDALTETPDMGVIRKFKTASGLIQYQPKGEPSDWVAAAKAILPTEKPDAIVVMLGLHDRIPIRETAPEKDGKKADKDKTDAASKSSEDEKSSESEPVDDEAGGEQPEIMAPGKGGARSRNGIAQFRSDRWTELYNKKIDEMIAVLKSKGVPVLWVGLPAVRGPKSTSDMLFLDSLYRDAAGKAGITYVDIWDGFVDDNGRYIQQGPDFEGQIRRLRSYDGVFFTKAGARKLAHYVEREITRVLASRSAPITLPSEPATPEAEAKPGQPAPRPLYGPIVPLVASSVGTDQLLGGAGTRPAAVDALVARTLVKGEPLSAPPGRADDFAWPRRAIANEPAPVGEPAVATTTAPDHTPGVSAAPPKPKKPRVPHEETAQQGGPVDFRNAPPPQQQQRPAAPRPPADVGFSPGGFFSGLFSR